MSRLRYEELHPQFGVSVRGVDLGRQLAPHRQVLGRQMGLEGGQQVFVAGFGLAIILIGQASVSQLHRRIADLEARLAGRAPRQG